jgi:hypothetical protein
MVPVLHLPEIVRRGARTERMSRYAQPSRGAAPMAPQDISKDGSEIFVGLVPTDTSASFDGGAVVVDPRCAVLFYGNAWNTDTVSPDAYTLLLKFASIINGSPYLSALKGYGVGSGVVLTGESRIIDKDPPNPFSPDDGADVVSGAIAGYFSKLDPREQPNMYSVILPPGVAFRSDESGDNGYHTNTDGNYYAVVLNGPVDQITTTFTHEFVETATDPNGDGWQVNPRNDSSWNEICDICEKAPLTYIGGVAVAAYFASYVGGQACLIPLPPVPPAPPPTLPDGDWLITNASFRSSSGIDYIYAIGGPIEDQVWTLTVDDAIARMQSGALSFHTVSPIDGSIAEVRIGHSLVASFLTTAADHTETNNLDYLAAHYPLPEEPVYWQTRARRATARVGSAKSLEHGGRS